jgi:hypothetical protein
MRRCGLPEEHPLKERLSLRLTLLQFSRYIDCRFRSQLASHCYDPAQPGRVLTAKVTRPVINSTSAISGLLAKYLIILPLPIKFNSWKALGIDDEPHVGHCALGFIGNSAASR